MQKLIIPIISFTLILTMWSCNEPNQSSNRTETVNSQTQNEPEYQSIKFIDSFYSANFTNIKKNNALKEHYEGLCTKKMLPLIDKKGFYNDIPFELAATTILNNIAYGNFIYSEDKHFIKVQCIIKKKQLESLSENAKYHIKFKVYKFDEGVSFGNSLSTRFNLPTPHAYLTDFKIIN